MASVAQERKRGSETQGLSEGKNESCCRHSNYSNDDSEEEMC